jgi:hypothetical protein
MWIATPSSQWTSTTYSLPVSRRTHRNSAIRIDHQILERPAGAIQKSPVNAAAAAELAAQVSGAQQDFTDAGTPWVPGSLVAMLIANCTAIQKPRNGRPFSAPCRSPGGHKPISTIM